jgi:hypothetical protein
MNLINKENVALLQVSENGSQVARALNDWPRCAFEIDLHLAGNDVSQGGFTKPWRTAEEQVVNAVAPMPCRFNNDAQILFDLFLANVVFKLTGA